MTFQPYFRTPLKVFARGRSGNFTPSPQAETRGEGLNVLEPTNCVGVWYRKMGNNECWEATGAVREIFKELSKEIKNHLKDWGEPGDPIVTWSIYMIGKTKTTAIPTLLFCCSKHGPRKSIKRQIVESGILRRYPNVRVGECSKPPDFGKFIPLRDPRNNKDDQLMLLAGTEYGQASFINDNADVDKTVFIHPTHRLLGSRIFGANMRTATTGISFQLYGRYFIITVGHIFSREDQSSDLDQDSDSEFDFEIPGVEGGSSDLTSGNSELDHYPPSPNLPAQKQAISKDGLIKLGTVVFSSTDAGNLGLDFSVVEIDQGYIGSNSTAIFAGTANYNSAKRQVSLEPTNQCVKAVTASNHALEGSLSGTPAFIRCSSGVGFQEVWAVKFNGQISQGDCGSLVVGIEDNVIHGHIIAGNPVSGMAYIVPASHIFNCLDSCIVPQDDVNHQATPPYEVEMVGIDRYPHFLTRRNIHDDEMLVDIEKVGASEDHLSAFTESTYTASRHDIEVLEDFCRGVSFENVIAGKGAAGYDKVVWIDDRKGNSFLEEGSVTRQCTNLLTATGLFQALKKPLFDHTDFPHTRRLIYIGDLSPACIHVLMATASRHQVPVLRNAIYKHLAFQVSIAVKISDRTTFQLDLHLPFFILNDSKPLKSHGGVNTKPWRSWTDLSFLQLSNHESDGVWGLHEAHISVVITGSDDWRWVGYGFVDCEIDGTLADLSPEELYFDQIAAGIFETDLRIWTPMDYFLRVFEIRIEQIKQHWEHLIYKVQGSVHQYLDYHPCTLSRERGKTSNTEEFFNWILKTIAVLQQIDGVLSETIAAWKAFISPDQSTWSILNTDREGVSLGGRRRSLQAINRNFQELQNYQMKIRSLSTKCSLVLKTLELRLAREGAEIADNNWVTSEFTVSILYPIALTTAFFSLEPEVIPFDQTRKSFAVTTVSLIAIVFVIRLVFRHIPRLSRLPSPQRKTISWIRRAALEGHYKPLDTRSQNKIVRDEKADLLGITTI